MEVSCWDFASIAVKALLYAATLAMAGGVFFLVYSASLLERADRATIGRRLIVLGTGAVLASAVRILLTAGSMSGAVSGMLDSGLLALVWHDGEGRAAMLRVAGFLLTVPALASVRRPGVPAIAGAAAAATSFAWVGHGHTTGLRSSIALLGIHLLAAAFWIGAFWPLQLLARGDDARRVAAAAARFGRAAVGAVSLLILAGATALSIMLGSFPQLWRTGYGRTACIKLALVAGILVLAAVNKWRLTPRVLAGERCAARALLRSIALEMVLAGGVLLATAALTTLSGPPAAAAR